MIWTISGKVLKFADDTKLYATVDNQAQGQSLQRDIDILGGWALQWQMKFNIDKCKVVHYGRNNIRFQYSLYGQSIAEVVSEKDLGVVFSSDLEVGVQCREAYNRANQSHSQNHKAQESVSTPSAVSINGTSTLRILLSSLQESALCIRFYRAMHLVQSAVLRSHVVCLSVRL